MTATEILAWADVASTLGRLGVRSWTTIRALMTEAGVAADDAALDALQVRWDALYADVARATGRRPAPR